MNANNEKLIAAIRESLGPNAVLLRVVPLGKNPVESGWQKIRSEQMNDPAYLASLSQDCNIGVALGEQSGGLCTLDIDVAAEIENFAACNPPLADTLRTTRVRGANFWLQIEGDYPPSGTIRDADGEPIGEWRSTGNQTVIAGTAIDKRKGEIEPTPYRRISNSRHPAKLLFSAIVWPAHWRLPWNEAHRAPKNTPRANAERDGKPDKAQIREMLALIPKRPDYADWIKIVAAVGDALPDNDAIEVLTEWSPEEKPGEYAEKLRYRLDDVTIGTLVYAAKQHGWQRKQPWQDPQPLPADLPDVPAFNLDWLPDTLRPWIADIAERMQCPPDFPAVGAMVALGSLVGRKIGIRPKRFDDWLEIPNLWGFVVGRPGLLKTPALQQALVLLRRLVAEALKRYETENREHEIGEMLTTQSKKLVEDAIKKDLKEDKKEDARKKAEEHFDAAHEKPVCRRYEVNDSTIEKLGELLSQNPNGLLLVRDELSGFLRSLDREDRAGDRAKYLEMWDGKGELTYDRIERGTVRIPSNTLSILGGIQPDVLTAYVREAVCGGTGNDGLLQRFQLPVWPEVSKEWRNVDRWPDTKAKNDAFGVFEYLDSLTAEAVGADASDGIAFLRFANDAQERFDTWRAELEKKLRSDTEHPAFEAHLAKYRKLVPALALLIHLAEQKTGPVCLGALSKALLWASYLEAHARRIYSAVLRPDTAAARELAKHLQRGDLPERFTLREIYRKAWAGLSSKEDAEVATEILCDLGWIRPAVDVPGRVPGAPGRAASQTFETNPKIPKCAPERTDKTDTNDSVSSVSDHQRRSENVGDAENADDTETLI